MKTRHKIVNSGRNHFERFVNKQAPSSENPLPLMHTTDAFDLRDIIRGQEIQPRYCDVFGHDLAYFFYGRPAYRKNGQVQANNLAAYAPIVLIFKPSIREEANVAFPFDSGAFKGEKYADVTHHRMSVQDFGLDPSYNTIGKVVVFFFGDNKRYYDQLPAPNSTIGANDFEAQSYRELTTYRGKNERDDRSTTIEFLFENSVQLKSNLLAIVVPNSFLEDKEVKQELQSLDVHILTYTDGAHLTPASQVPLLVDVVRHFYIKQGIIKN